jgi:hypothetical protein
VYFQDSLKTKNKVCLQKLIKFSRYGISRNNRLHNEIKHLYVLLGINNCNKSDMNFLLYVFIDIINIEAFRNLNHTDTIQKFVQNSSEMERLKFTKVILPFVLFRHEISSHQPRVFQNRMLSRIFGPKRK